MRRNTKLRAGWLALSATTAIAGALPATAQTSTPPAATPPTFVEDIVVTAQRREESVQDVPIAISAFSSTELERRNVDSAIELVQYIPNMIGNANTGLGTANTYFIRGVGDTESLASKDPPVGTYIDDIFFSRQSANNFSLFDVERIEVLRGPQGTLFGRNTTGGAINVILRKPSETFGGYAELGFGSYQLSTARASVDIPVGPTFLTKVSAYYTDDNGYVQNTTTGERLNDERNYGGRLAVRALPSDSVTWDASIIYMHAAGTNLTNFTCDPANPTNCNGRFATTGLRKGNNGVDQFPGVTIANGKGSFPLGNKTDSVVLTSNLEFRGSDVTVNLITGFIDTRQKYNVDFFDGRAVPTFTFVNDPATNRPSASNVSGNVSLAGPVRGLTTGGFVFAADAKTQQFTQEIKITGNAFGGFLDYVGGFYYFDERSVSDFADIATNVTTRVAALSADRTLRNGTEALAVYAQFDANIAPWLKLTAGARYTDERKQYAFRDNRPACQVIPVLATCIDSGNFASVDTDLNPATPPVTLPLTQRVKLWTPRFAINVKPNDDFLFFVSATNGFKSGGQSARSTAVRLLLPFGPEKVWSYEAGIRSEFFDKRLRANLTAFYADTKDAQGGSAFVTTNPTTGAQTLSFVTRNFAGLRNTGFEFDIQAVPVRGLTIFISGGYQDARYVVNQSAPDLDAFGVLSVAAQQRECIAALAGGASPRGDTRLAAARAQSACGTGVVTTTGTIAKPVRAPKLTLAGGFSYEMNLPTAGISLTPSVNVVYTSSQQVGASNVSFYRNAAGLLNVTGGGEFITGAFSRAHTLINASLSLKTDDGLWSAALECSNCTDVAYPQSAASNLNYFNPPRTWQFKMKRKF